MARHLPVGRVHTTAGTIDLKPGGGRGGGGGGSYPDVYTRCASRYTASGARAWNPYPRALFTLSERLGTQTPK